MSKRAKISRRKAIATLASGAVGVGAAIGGSSDTVTCQSAACGGVAKVTVPTTGPSVQTTNLISSSCCADTKATLLTASGQPKTHLQPLLTKLQDNNTHLLEYCVMVWGIKKDAVKQMEDLLTPRLQDWKVSQ
jgi:hypothetical protein